LNYDAIAAEFGEQVTLNTLRIRMSTLKKMGESGNFQKGKITRRTLLSEDCLILDLKTTKNGAKQVKKEAPIKQEMDKVEVLDEEWL
jgi:hypothetical protein